MCLSYTCTTMLAFCSKSCTFQAFWKYTNTSSLFRPYIKLDLQGANLYPRDTCTVCANEISSLMNALRAMYGLRRIALPVASVLLSASTIHLLNLPSEPSASHLSQALRDLQAMSTNHQFAAQCVSIVRSLAKKWKIPLPESAASVSALQIPGQQLSPTSSNFWSASIPGQLSSSGTRSNESSASHHESPFAPPQQGQATSSYPNFYNEPLSRIDTSQMQAMVWTPFPGQTMPVPQQHIVPTMQVDMSGMDEQSSQWAAFGTAMSLSTAHSQANAGQIAMPTTMADNMSFQSWQWQ